MPRLTEVFTTVRETGTPFDKRAVPGQQPQQQAGGQGSAEQQWLGLMKSGQVQAHGPGTPGGDHIFFISTVDGRYMLSADAEGEIKIEKQD